MMNVSPSIIKHWQPRHMRLLCASNYGRENTECYLLGRCEFYKYSVYNGPVNVKTVADAVQNDKLEAIPCAHSLSLRQVGA